MRMTKWLMMMMMRKSKRMKKWIQSGDYYQIQFFCAQLIQKT